MSIVTFIAGAIAGIFSQKRWDVAAQLRALYHWLRMR